VTPLLLSHFTATTCLGRGLGPTRAALEGAASGLKHCDFETVRLDTWIGEVAGVDEIRLPAALARHDCRNNRLALMGLETDGFADALRAATGRYGRRQIGRAHV
jgi:3-oxoacyl-[acyl-carrier-protein] synthase-1